MSWIVSYLRICSLHTSINPSSTVQNTAQNNLNRTRARLHSCKQMLVPVTASWILFLYNKVKGRTASCCFSNGSEQLKLLRLHIVHNIQQKWCKIQTSGQRRSTVWGKWKKLVKAWNHKPACAGRHVAPAVLKMSLGYCFNPPVYFTDDWTVCRVRGGARQRCQTRL